MKNTLTQFKELKICDVDIKEIIKNWNKRCFISQWNEEYILCQYDKKAKPYNHNLKKTKISKSQAEELIKNLDLKDTMSELFVNAHNWH